MEMEFRLLDFRLGKVFIDEAILIEQATQVVE
jgi:hypothetical protein